MIGQDVDVIHTLVTVNTIRLPASVTQISNNMYLKSNLLRRDLAIKVWICRIYADFSWDNALNVTRDCTLSVIRLSLTLGQSCWMLKEMRANDLSRIIQFSE